MILHFGSFTRRGFLVDLERPEELLGGQITDRVGGGGEGQRGDGTRQKDHRPASGERVRPKDSASSREIPMILNALFPQREAEKGERWDHQPRRESSTPSGCG